VLNGGKAMSKSLGNGVDLGEQLDKYGVDAVRLTMIFASPPEDDVDWADVSPSGSAKFLARAWTWPVLPVRTLPAVTGLCAPLPTALSLTPLNCWTPTSSTLWWPS
jgi:hypothetical protein